MYIKDRIVSLLTRRVGIAIGASLAVLVFLLVGPFILSGYWVRVLSAVFMYAALATSMNIMTGYTGYVDFGNVVFLGVGAYTTAILMDRMDLPLPAAVLAGGIVCMLYAGLLGWPILRLRGHYFAIATIGVNEATREIVRNLSGLTGGGMGITLPLSGLGPKDFNTLIYFTMFVLMLTYVGIIYIITRRPLGYALRSIRDNEDAAAVMGIDTARYKVIAWSTSAFLTGVIGGVFAYWYTYIEPPAVFNINISVRYLIMMLLGGGGTIFGPVIGAFLLGLLSELIWGRFLELHMAILGLAIILVVIFMPGGFTELIRRRLSLSAILASIRESRV